MQVHFFVLVILSAFTINCCLGKKIVVLYSMGSKSHFYAVRPIVEELAQRGHQITVFTPFKDITRSTENIKEIVLPAVEKKLEATFSNVDFFAMNNQTGKQILATMFDTIDLIVAACEELITHPEFRKIVRERDVDLFIVDALGNEFNFPIIEQLGVPFVIHSSSAAMPTTLEAMGAPIDYASVPTIMSEFDDRMTFLQRIMNIMSVEMLKPVRKHLIFRRLDAVLQREYPGVRPILEVEGEASLYITNTHPATNWPRSLPPTILSIGALHAQPAKSLPQKFQTIADGAKDGFIIFTLGSFISVSKMPKNIVDTFIRVFSKLPQRVIWKWEADVPENTPSNIIFVDWIPQQDLLGNPNAKLLITHAGMLGTQEAAYHGVPILGLPLGNDQKSNIAKAVRDGWGLRLDWDQIDDKNLDEAINYLINDPSVKKNTKKVSLLIHDEILPGKDVASYWIEYVIRHGSTKHLQLASKNMPFYRRHLLDVAFVLISFAAAALVITYKITRVLLRRAFKGKPSDKPDKIKEN